MKLEELCALGSPSIIRGVHNLLLLVPTDPSVMHAVEGFAPQEVGGGASEDSAPSSQDGSRPSPQAVLDQFFSTSRTTPTQLLYNLEVRGCENYFQNHLISLPPLSPPPPSPLSPSPPQVLSSRLIPIPPVPLHEPQKESSYASSLQFRRSFLEHGGLKSVINVLQRNALPSHVDLTIRQDCYAIALTLARYVGDVLHAVCNNVVCNMQHCILCILCSVLPCNHQQCCV